MLVFSRMEWLQQGSRELFGTIIEDQVTTQFHFRREDSLTLFQRQVCHIPFERREGFEKRGSCKGPKFKLLQSYWKASHRRQIPTHYCINGYCTFLVISYGLKDEFGVCMITVRKQTHSNHSRIKIIQIGTVLLVL